MVLSWLRYYGSKVVCEAILEGSTPSLSPQADLEQREFARLKIGYDSGSTPLVGICRSSITVVRWPVKPEGVGPTPTGGVWGRGAIDSMPAFEEQQQTKGLNSCSPLI